MKSHAGTRGRKQGSPKRASRPPLRTPEFLVPAQLPEGMEVAILPDTRLARVRAALGRIPRRYATVTGVCVDGEWLPGLGLRFATEVRGISARHACTPQALEDVRMLAAAIAIRDKAPTLLRGLRAPIASLADGSPLEGPRSPETDRAHLLAAFRAVVLGIAIEEQAAILADSLRRRFETAFEVLETLKTAARPSLAQRAVAAWLFVDWEAGSVADQTMLASKLADCSESAATQGRARFMGLVPDLIAVQDV